MRTGPSGSSYSRVVVEPSPGASGKQWKALDKSGEGVLSGLSRRRAFSDSPLVRENQQHVLASPTSRARAAPTSALHRCSERDVKSLPSQSVARGCGHPSSDTTGLQVFLTGELVPAGLAG